MKWARRTGRILLICMSQRIEYGESPTYMEQFMGDNCALPTLILELEPASSCVKADCKYFENSWYFIVLNDTMMLDLLSNNAFAGCLGVFLPSSSRSSAPVRGFGPFAAATIREGASLKAVPRRTAEWVSTTPLWFLGTDRIVWAFGVCWFVFSNL